MTSCSPGIPHQWEKLHLSNDHLFSVEKETDQNGLYLEYRGTSREALFESITQSLVAAGYQNTGKALEGHVLGFEKGPEQLAVKIDQFDDSLYLAVFNASGKEPLLHGLVFGKYTTGPEISGNTAKQMLMKDFEN